MKLLVTIVSAIEVQSDHETAGYHSVCNKSTV